MDKNQNKMPEAKAEDQRASKSKKRCKRKNPKTDATAAKPLCVPAKEIGKGKILGAKGASNKAKHSSVPNGAAAKDKDKAKATKSAEDLTMLKKKRKKKQMVRKVSNLVFVMPKSEDPQAKAQAISEKKVSKLIRYMRKYWVVKVDKKFYPTKIDFRAPDRMTHQRPYNWWLIKRARQKTLEHTGFYSNVQEPYHDLGPPELDSSMLVFKNMHVDLPIDPSKWIQDRQLKEELMRKCNAPLVRLPRAKVRRPQFNKGRVKVGCGGILNINKYVQKGYEFQNGIRGDYTYTQSLDHYMDQKGNESADLASAFGVMGKKPGADSNKGKDEKHNKAGAPRNKDWVGGDEGDSEHVVLKSFADSSKDTTLDDRGMQRNMLHFEKMMSAIYDIVRSLLNMKPSHLKSNYSLPSRVVAALRSTSPVKEVVIKKPPVTTLSYKNMLPKKNEVLLPFDEEEEEEYEDEEEEDYEEEELEDVPQEDEWMETIMEVEEHSIEIEETEAEETKSQSLLRRAKESRRKLPDIPPFQTRTIASNVVATVKADHVLKARPGPTPEEKIRNLRENPEGAALRQKANLDLYNRLFHGSEPEKPAIWKHVNVDLDATPRSSMKSIPGQAQSQTARIEEDPSAAGTTLPSNSKIPHLGEITTPILSGLESPLTLDSEEHSRQNFLKKNPEAASKEPPSSPIQHLYKVAGILTTEQQMARTVLSMKKKFRVAEKSLRFYYANEVDKEDWLTMSRFRHKILALQNCPIYEKSIGIMRESVGYTMPEDEQSRSSESSDDKRPSLWYRKLRERFEELGAGQHLGCATIITKLLKYCDADLKTKPKMVNKMCLLVVSLPTTELGSRQWQMAIKFMLDHFFGMPAELFYQWLDYRRLPPLI